MERTRRPNFKDEKSGKEESNWEMMINASGQDFRSLCGLGMKMAGSS